MWLRGAEFFLSSWWTFSWSRNSPLFYTTRTSITAFKRTRHWTSWIQLSSHPIFLRHILILSSHLHFCLPSGDVSSRLSTKFCIDFVISPVTVMRQVSASLAYPLLFLRVRGVAAHVFRHWSPVPFFYFCHRKFPSAFETVWCLHTSAGRMAYMYPVVITVFMGN
jgi:hypothetical protein